MFQESTVDPKNYFTWPTTLPFTISGMAGLESSEEAEHWEDAHIDAVNEDEDDAPADDDEEDTEYVKEAIRRQRAQHAETLASRRSARQPIPPRVVSSPRADMVSSNNAPTPKASRTQPRKKACIKKPPPPSKRAPKHR